MPNEISCLSPTLEFKDQRVISQLLIALYRQILSRGKVDLIIQISDLQSPGGLVIGSEMLRLFESEPPGLLTAHVTTSLDATGVSRSAVDLSGLATEIASDSILIVDDVIFTGKTMKATIDSVQRSYPNAQLLVACLVKHIGTDLQNELEFQSIPVFVGATTANREVTFPWGTAQWFGEITNRFGGSESRFEVVKRPWGFYEEFAQNRECTTRVHTLEPKQRMSLQRHRMRDEFFLILDRGISYVLDERELEAHVGEYVFVPRMTWHRLINNSGERARVLEVAFGQYDQAGDIERREDDYNRTDKDGAV